MRPIPALIMVPAALLAPAPLYAAEYLTVPQAQQQLFPEADHFVDAAVQLSDDQRKAIEKKSGVRQRWQKQAVWRAEKAAALVGWFIVDEVVGKHEFITYAVGTHSRRQSARTRDPRLPRDPRLSDSQPGVAGQVRRQGA